MKRQRVLCLLLALSLALGLAVTAQAAERRAADFPDFDSRAWYAEAMTAAVEDGLLRGTDKGLLNPQGDLTRAEMAAIINRAFGTYALGDVSSYRDVSPQAWYYSDVRMAVSLEFIRRDRLETETSGPAFGADPGAVPDGHRLRRLPGA